MQCQDMVMATWKSQLVTLADLYGCAISDEGIYLVKRARQGSSVGGSCAGSRLRRWSVKLLLVLQADKNEPPGLWAPECMEGQHLAQRYAALLQRSKSVPPTNPENKA
ncbi:hypothetical protein E6O75_ATG11040 [Venturia nashicola]|uniref:Uncharacterized protein n=1 Tax=Venturia nashicola TaxID=86259 RepID=A0A4Z1PB35_9PEZI|nr:hypothetical protein E6O75_ATG11040 [Venturia nashicola]